MKKKNLRPLILSSLTALAMAGIGTGATFALFTDKAETSIKVEAGIVDYSNTIEHPVTYSARANALGNIVDENLQRYESVDRDSLDFENGGLATVTNSLITLDKMTPGDGIKFNFATKNKSNVKTKYRFTIKTNEDGAMLASTLDIKIKNETLNMDKTYHGLKTLITKWNSADALEDLGTFSFDISMPITAGNAYQNLSLDLYINLEAVQGNAVTVDEEKEDLITGVINDTNEVPFAKENGYWVLNNDIDYSGLGSLDIPSDKDVTLDLNGHSLLMNSRSSILGKMRFVDSSFDNSGEYTNAIEAPFLCKTGSKVVVEEGTLNLGKNTFVLYSDSEFEMNGGTINSTDGGLFCQGEAAKVIINDGEINAAGVGIYCMSQYAGNDTNRFYDITINGGKIKGSDGINSHNKGIININGGEIIGENSFGMTTNGDTSRDSIINITGGSIKGKGIGFYCASCNELNISGGHIIGENTSGLEFRGGKLSVSGNPVFETSATDIVLISENDNGSTAKGIALAIAQHVTTLPIDVSVTGGTYKGICGLSIANPQENTTDNITFNVTGGNFEGSLVDLLNVDSRVNLVQNDGLILDKMPLNLEIGYKGVLTNFVLTANTYNYTKA